MTCEPAPDPAGPPASEAAPPLPVWRRHGPADLVQTLRAAYRDLASVDVGDVPQTVCRVAADDTELLALLAEVVAPWLVPVLAAGGEDALPARGGWAAGDGGAAGTVTAAQARSAMLELHRLAHTDVLTGLANRARLEGRVRLGLQRRRGPADRLALMMLDLDRFKLVNDTLGHHVGDELLVEVAARLCSVARAGTTVARLGGDEFVLLLEGVDGPADALAVAGRVAEVLREPVVLRSGDTVVCSASIGIALSEPGVTPADLHRHADLALYRAKEEGRDRAALYDDELRARAVHRLDSEARLRRALAGDGVRVYHQPLVDVLTGQVVGHEALARLVDPAGGLLAPTDVLAVAEDTGMVVELDTRVLDAATAQLASAPGGLLAVNVSSRTLVDGGYPDRLAAAAARHRLDPSRLLVEVGERALLDVTPAVTRSLRALEAMGVRTGIDNFGTGYSSLSYLPRFRLDFLKIDRSFVARLGQGRRDDAVVAAIITLAHAHDLTVTAQGVETAEQLARLRAMGCDRAQGYLFAPPGPGLRPLGPAGPLVALGRGGATAALGRQRALAR